MPLSVKYLYVSNLSNVISTISLGDKINLILCSSNVFILRANNSSSGSINDTIPSILYFLHILIISSILFVVSILDTILYIFVKNNVVYFILPFVFIIY